jgi:hypothetical protein
MTKTKKKKTTEVEPKIRDATAVDPEPEVKAITGLEPKIGRGNPPKHTQFPKGTSGNLRGRPRGSKNLRTLVLEAAKQPTMIEIDGKQRRISNLQATTLQLANKAAKGDPKSMAAFLDWVDEIQTQAAREKPAEFPLGEHDVEVLRAVYERLKQCDADKIRKSET